MATSKIRVTLVKSLAHQLSDIVNSARGLGLRRIRHTVEVEDTPSNRGMINRASHLLKVEKA
jgi:large subunit ribosomal protein L30